MPRPKKPPEYFEARSAINQHLHRHHAGALGQGMLEERLTQHEELHILAKRLGIAASHTHEVCADGEDDVALAFRLLEEGEAQDGQADATTRT
jgi:hypothetical protein